MTEIMNEMPMTEALKHLSDMIDSAEDTHEIFHIIKDSAHRAVLMSEKDFNRMKLTMEVLSDPDTMAAIKEYEENPEDTYSLEEVKEELKRMGRLP